MTASTPRSGLVTGTAWVSIVIAGLLMALAAFQYGMLRFFMPPGMIEDAMTALPLAGDLGITAQQVTQTASALLVGVFLASALVAAISVAMLRRREWGRIGFVVMMWATVVVNLLGLLAMLIGADATVVSGQLGEDAGRLFFWLNLLLLVVVGLASAWLAWYLGKPAVKREFGAD